MLVLDGFLVEQVGHLGGNVFFFRRVRNDGELFLLGFFGLGIFGVRRHKQASSYSKRRTNSTEDYGVARIVPCMEWPLSVHWKGYVFPFTA